jgi:hypothetical protein
MLREWYHYYNMVKVKDPKEQLKAKGIPPEIISECTALSVDEIAKI